MSALIGPFHIICGVLAVAGVAKLRDPLPTRQALYRLGASVPPQAVRLLGLAEVVLAVTAVLVGGVAAPLAVAAVHVVFTVVSARMAIEGTTPCGCFGSGSAPATLVHVLVNASSAAVAVAIAATGARSVPDVLDELGIAQGVAHGIAVAAGTGAVVLVLTVLPLLSTLRRGQSPSVAA